MRYGNDPRSPELLCDGSGLKKQPRRLKVILSKAENTKFRLLQFGCEPLCPRFTGAYVVRDEDLDRFLKEILQKRLETECRGFAALP